MRELLDEERENNDRRARLAIEIFCYRARKYIGAYLAAMGGADAVVFTGGIGERSPLVRGNVLDRLKVLNVHSLVVPTDEERMIAADTLELA